MYRLFVQLFVFLFFLSASAQQISINIKGKVTSQSSGKAVAGATLTLKDLKISTTTDNQGSFSIVKVVPVLWNPILPNAEKISLDNGSVNINLTKPSPVGIELFDIKGNLLKKVADHPASAGHFRFDIASQPWAATMMMIRVSVGNRVSSFRYLPLTGNRTTGQSFTAAPTASGLAKIQTTVDSLKVSSSGFKDKGVALSSYEQQNLTITLDSAPAASLTKFSFFVTSMAGLQRLSGKDVGFGGDLRFGKTGQGAGLLGADSICQCLAEASMPGSKVKGWRAYLSVSKDASGKQVNAIDRVGAGPWYDRLGRMFAKDVSELKLVRPTSCDKAIKEDLPNEDGVPNHRPDPNKAQVDNHLTITGSDSLGRLYSSKYANNPPCQDWTSTDTVTPSHPRCGISWTRAGMFGIGKQAMINPGGMGNMEGMADMGNMNSWNSFWSLPGCMAGYDLQESTAAGAVGDRRIGAGGGYGGFYCFALQP
jgi:hypothetical protein